MTCCEKFKDRKQQYTCEKHHMQMCAACFKCKDPELYCKFRPSCMIHFLEKERKKEKAASQGSSQ
jgi:hypothetical protein